MALREIKVHGLLRGCKHAVCDSSMMTEREGN